MSKRRGVRRTSASPCAIGSSSCLFHAGFPGRSARLVSFDRVKLLPVALISEDQRRRPPAPAVLPDEFSPASNQETAPAGHASMHTVLLIDG